MTTPIPATARRAAIEIARGYGYVGGMDGQALKDASIIARECHLAETVEALRALLLLATTDGDDTPVRDRAAALIHARDLLAKLEGQ